MTNPFDTVVARWMQTIEQAEAHHFDELSNLELFQVLQELEELRAELHAFDAKARALLHRQAFAPQLN